MDAGTGLADVSKNRTGGCGALKQSLNEIEAAVSEVSLSKKHI